MTGPKLDPKFIHNVTDLLAAAMYIDRYVIDAMNRLDEDFSGINSLAIQTFKQFNRNKTALNNKVKIDKEVPGDDVNFSMEEIISCNERMEEKADTPTLRLQRLCACCDQSFSFYEAIIETTNDDIVMLAAKEQASSARDRIDILRQALGKECGCECEELGCQVNSD
jgi:hypothetical protein